MQPQQNQVDKLIYQLRRNSPAVSWKEITEQVNQMCSSSYSINDLIYRYEIMNAKLTKQQIADIFEQFQHAGTNFEAISQQTGIALNQVKRQIIGGLVNNIWKVCFIVRKRKISTLKSNFISNDQIKKLVVLMLRQSNLQNIKLNYSLLWNFIIKVYPDDFYHSVHNEHYKQIYTQLIILVEQLKISNNQRAQQTTSNYINSFERNALIESQLGNTMLERIHQSIMFQQNGNQQQQPEPQIQNTSKVEQEQIHAILQLARNRKKGEKPMINLVSESEQQQQSEQQHSEITFQMNEQGRYVVDQDSALKEHIHLCYDLHLIETELSRRPNNPILQQQKIQKCIAISCLELILQQGEGQ